MRGRVAMCVGAFALVLTVALPASAEHGTYNGAHADLAVTAEVIRSEGAERTVRQTVTNHGPAEAYAGESYEGFETQIFLQFGLRGAQLLSTSIPCEDDPNVLSESPIIDRRCRVGQSLAVGESRSVDVRLRLTGSGGSFDGGTSMQASYCSFMCRNATEDPNFDNQTASIRFDELRELVKLTMLVDGPGQIIGPGFECDKQVCTITRPSGTRIDMRAEAKDVDNKGFSGWAGPCVIAGDFCTIVLTEDATVTAKFDPVRIYAPELMFHPEEKFFPSNPTAFFFAARLKWFTDKPSRYYEPCKVLPGNRKTIARNPVASKIKSKRSPYKFKFCWGNPTDNQTRTFKSSRLTAPAVRGQSKDGPKTGKFNPRRSGFYLDIKDDDPILPGRSPGDNNYNGGRDAPPLFYQYRPQRYIVYWFFSAFNNRRFDKHQGDWEHISIKLDSGNRATQVAFYQHLCPPRVSSWEDVRIQPAADGPQIREHPNVYIARGGHGAWRQTGTTLGRTCKENKGFYDVREGSGPRWRTWKSTLADATNASWYDLGVGWGREGGIGYGPVGPGRFKKGVVPKGW